MCGNLPPRKERIASLCLQVGERVLTVVCAYVQNSSSEYPPFLESLENILERAPTGDSVGLLGDLDNDSETLMGVIGMSN